MNTTCIGETMTRAAKSGIAALLAGLLMFGAVLGHRTAAAAGPARQAAPGLVARHSVTRAAAATIAAHIFAELAASAGKSLAQVIAQDDPALGWLLPASARRELLHTQQLKEVNQSLASLKEQVAGAQHQIAIDDFSNLVAHTAAIRASIETAARRLQELAALPAGSPDAVKDANRLREYIEKNLLKAPEDLEAMLAPKVPLASNLIESASRLVMHRDRFFGTASSAEVMSVYTAFAAYQTQLAVLLQNYYHDSDKDSPTSIASELDHLRRNIEGQKRSLKPPVPENTVIDTKTHEMWTADVPTGASAPSREVPMKTIATLRLTNEFGPKYHYVLLKPAGPTAVHGLPFENWKLPDVNRFKTLLEGRDGQSPIDWLVKGGFNRAFLEAGDGLKWTDETPHVNTIVVFSSMDVRRFSLRTGELQSIPVTWGTQTDGWQHWFDHFRAGLVYYRAIPADEKYWW